MLPGNEENRRAARNKEKRTPKHERRKVCDVLPTKTNHGRHAGCVLVVDQRETKTRSCAHVHRSSNTEPTRSSSTTTDKLLSSASLNDGSCPFVVVEVVPPSPFNDVVAANGATEAPRRTITMLPRAFFRRPARSNGLFYGQIRYRASVNTGRKVGSRREVREAMVEGGAEKKAGLPMHRAQ